MSEIWYLLRCPAGNEADYIEKCRKLTEEQELKEIICFQYQRLMRYGGSWHLERRTLLPGHIFLSGSERAILGKMGRKRVQMEGQERGSVEEITLSPCELPYLKMLCSDDGLVDMSRGIIKEGIPVVTEGPLKGHEHLIEKIDRHKRIAELRVPLDGKAVKVTVGLEIYQKEI